MLMYLVLISGPDLVTQVTVHVNMKARKTLCTLCWYLVQLVTNCCKNIKIANFVITMFTSELITFRMVRDCSQVK